MYSPSIKYYEWMVECANVINLRNSEMQKRRIAAAIATIAAIGENKRRKYKKKKYWVAEIFENRAVHGFYHAIFPILRLEDSRFINYFRMSATEFEELLCLVGPTISKQYVVRDPISAPERLALTLRFVYTFKKCVFIHSFVKNILSLEILGSNFSQFLFGVSDF